jgi:hypothetical protein
MRSRYGLTALSNVFHAMPARPPITAYGNVRGGPTAMSFVRSIFFRHLFADQ